MSKINEIEEIPEGTFLVSLKLIEKYQQTETIPMDKYKDGKYHTGSFCGGNNIYLILITCDYNTVIPSMIQSYVLN